MTTKKLTDLLTDEQLNSVVKIIDNNPDSISRVAKLKEYLGQFADQLEKKGVVSDYLAYYLEYMTLFRQESPEIPSNEGITF